MASYPKVERSHIVPRTYLRNFADNDGMIGMRLVDDSRTLKVISIDHAAVWKRFYRRTRPDGTPIDDVEHSLSLLENRAGPLLRNLEERWPLDFEGKRVLGELFAIQLLRGVRWRRGYDKRTTRLVEDYRQSGLFDDEVAKSELTIQEVTERNREFFASDTMRLRRMLFASARGSSVFGSMIWALIRFPKPVLVTADHPVTGWSRWETSSRPKPTPDGLGLMHMLEVRVPVSPTAAILMTWLDRSADIGQPFEGTRQHARNLNAFTIAQAKRQWFHLPGTEPSYGKRRAYPSLGMELFRGYGPDLVENSALRRVVSEKVNAKLGEETNEYEIIRLDEDAKKL